MVKMQIIPETLEIEIREMNAEGHNDFVTDGSYKGFISAVLSIINPVWTTRSSGDKGTLTLKGR